MLHQITVRDDFGHTLDLNEYLRPRLKGGMLFYFSEEAPKDFDELFGHAEKYINVDKSQRMRQEQKAIHRHARNEKGRRTIT